MADNDYKKNAVSNLSSAIHNLQLILGAVESGGIPQDDADMEGLDPDLRASFTVHDFCALKASRVRAVLPDALQAIRKMEESQARSEGPS